MQPGSKSELPAQWGKKTRLQSGNLLLLLLGAKKGNFGIKMDEVNSHRTKKGERVWLLLLSNLGRVVRSLNHPLDSKSAALNQLTTETAAA